MRRIFERIVIGALLVVTLFSVVACGKKPQDDSTTPSTPTTNTTEIDLVKDGTSQYRIVIPDNASEILTFAANELELNIKNSTGVTLPIVTSSAAGDDLSAYNLSVGNTALAAKANVSGEKLNKTGFTLAVKQNSLIMVGGSDYGALYAAYEFLEQNFGYHFYCEEEIVIDSLTSVKLLDFNYTYEPPIGDIHIESSWINNGYGIYRYKANNSQWPMGWPHSFNWLMPPAEYPQYYKMGNHVLCLSDNDMWKDCARECIERLEANPDWVGIMLGSEDAWGQCGCDDCQEYIKKYTWSGTLVVFGNYVAKAVREHFEGSGRNPYIMLLAYFNTESAPVKTDENGNTVLMHEDLKGDSNLYVEVCPFKIDMSSSIHSDANKGIKNTFENWKLVTDNLWAWIYDAFFIHREMLHAFDWEYQTDIINFLADLGYEEVHWEIECLPFTPFGKLRAYYNATMLFDPSEDANAVIDGFMDQYYKEAAPYIKEYFYTINLNYKLFQAKMAEQNRVVGQYVQIEMNNYLYNTDLWTELLLDQSLELFDKAIQAIEESDAYDDTERDVMLARVKQEQLVPRNYKLRLYKSSYETEEYNRLVDELNADIALYGGIVKIEK